MKHITKGTLVAFLCLVLMLCLFPAFTAADASGQCGDNLYWSFNSSTGKLTITGSGDMYNYSSKYDIYSDILRTTAPWWHDAYYWKIKEVSLPDGLTSIGDHAFHDFRSLRSITIPNSVARIGYYAFCNCPELTSIIIPRSVTSICEYAFASCPGLIDVTIEGNVKNMNGSAFGCRNLTQFNVASGNETLAVVDGVLFSFDKTTLIAYPDGKSDASYTIPESVTAIGNSAFSGAKLRSITIPNSVTSIGSFAINSLENLTTVTLGNGVRNIASQAFAGSDSLTDIYYQGNREQRSRLSITFEGNQILYGETVTWHYLPTITTQPDSVTPKVGATATFKIEADDAIDYQWQYQRPNDTAWHDAQDNGKSATFDQTNVAARHDGFKFRCKVTSASGSVYSNEATLTVVSAPTITSQPSSVTKDLGATATFKVTAANATSYQWQYQKPGNSTWYDVQNNGKSDTFNQTNVEKRHNGFVFRCKVTNGVGTVYSNTAKLTVITTAPTISSHPSAVTKDVGNTATFKVVATGATGYQWQYQKPGDSTWYSVLDNGKSATFNQTNLQKRHDGFVFRCKVTNGIGSVYSNTAKLTVPTTAPTISSHPSAVIKDLGATATFKVTAANATSYQWQYQIPGSSTWNDVQNNGKSATFNQTNLEKRHNGYLFRCKVTNGVGSVFSNTAKLTVPTTAPTITGQPNNVTTTLGSTATFKVVASNATAYQWQFMRPGETTWNDAQVNGKSATFNQTNVEQRHNGFQFRCKVTNGIGSVFSNSAKLTVATTAPTISSQPSNVTATLGSTATFKVTSANATSYQWQYQRPGESTWNEVQDNGKSATFNQTNVAARHNGFKFRCKVSNANGTVYSSEATLTVK